MLQRSPMVSLSTDWHSLMRTCLRLRPREGALTTSSRASDSSSCPRPCRRLAFIPLVGQDVSSYAGTFRSKGDAGHALARPFPPAAGEPSREAVLGARGQNALFVRQRYRRGVALEDVTGKLHRGGEGLILARMVAPLYLTGGTTLVGAPKPLPAS